MLHGDISNQSGTTIAFRCEDFLIKFHNDTLTDKVVTFFAGKERRAEVDNKVLSVMEHLYRNTEYNVDLVIERKNYTDKLKSMVEDMPCSRVVLIDNLNNIGSRILVGDLSYYVDDDYERRRQINSNYAVTLNELRSMTRIGR